MLKNIILCISFLLLMIASAKNSYAAFPITHKEAVAASVVSPSKPTFAQRKVPQYLSHLKHNIFPGRVSSASGAKTGWQGIASFCCAVLAIPILYVSAPLFFLLAILGIIFGAIGLGKRYHTNTGFAMAGLILGSLEIVLTVALIILVVNALKSL